MSLGRPAADEYAHFYAGYVARVPDGDIIAILSAQLETLTARLGSLSREQALARPTPSDWNALEVLGHITDGEQIFASRALRIARGDATPQPGFEQDDYVNAANFAEQPLEQLLAVYTAMRRASIALYASISDEAWLRRGTVSGQPCSARAWPYIAAGHELHHLVDFAERYGI
jgi:uncharacterized damage-inducible protein DinB